MRVTTPALPSPRPRVAVERVVGASPRERRGSGRQGHREPIVVHVPVPLGPGGASCAVRDAYRLESDRRAVDVYL